jgi:hypothetical protein
MRDVKGLTGDGVPRRRTRLGDTVMGRLSRLGSYAHGKAGEWEYSRLRCPAPTLSLPVMALVAPSGTSRQQSGAA